MSDSVFKEEITLFAYYFGEETPNQPVFKGFFHIDYREDSGYQGRREDASCLEEWTNA